MLDFNFNREVKMEWPAIVTSIALLEYMFFTFKVGLSRNKYGVHAPAVTGNEIWERLYRVQQNTLEQLIVFIPVLWIFAHFVSPIIASVIGLVFIVGRGIYYISYVKNPSGRAVGFVLGFFANVTLLAGGLAGAIYNLL